MTEAALIVASMQSDIDRLGHQMGARTTRLAREAIADLQRDIKPSIGPWGVANKVAAMTQILGALEQLAVRQAGVLTGTARAIAGASQGRMVALLHSLDTRFTGSATPLRFDTLAWLEHNAGQLAKTRLRVYGTSFARYGAAAVGEIEDELAKLALTGQPWTKARARVHAAIRDVVGDRQWMVDRILRTETSAIYNGTALAAMIDEDTPDSPMLKRLVATFDRLTGRDSMAVDGQVRAVRLPFSDGKREYMAPPNRPHDREIVVPHRARWGPNLPRLSAPPPVPAETSTPDLPPPPPARKPKADLPPAVAGRLATAAAAVTLLAGRLQERRRAQRILPLDQRDRSAEQAMLRELAGAQLSLAAAGLAADLARGDGLLAGGLTRGEVVTAGGLAVRVAAVQVVGDQVELVLAVGGAKVRVVLLANQRLPLRRAAPTFTPPAWQAHAAMLVVADALRQSVTPASADGTLVARAR